MGLLIGLWNGLKALPGLIFPFLAKASDWRHWSPWVRWVLHFVVIVLVLAILGYLNYYFDLERVLRAPFPILRKIWLPLLFLLIYIQGWLGLYLWKVLGAEDEASAFPDIDTAWQDAQAALVQAGIDIREVPLYLILGQPTSGIANLFTASQMNLVVRGMPRWANAPVQVYANREGIYVVSANASLLARQVSFQEEQDEAQLLPRPPAWSPPLEGTPPPGEDVPIKHPGSPVLTWQSISAPEPVNAGGVATEQLLYLDSVDLPGAGEQQLAQRETGQTKRALLLQNTQETELATARLKHLCRLVTQARQPYCPVNGLLLLLPWVMTSTEAEANHASRLCQRELDIVRDSVRLQVPVFALICDMEQDDGFREILTRLPAGQRRSLLGLGLPLVPDCKPAEVADILKRGVAWVCDTLFPLLIVRLFRLASAGAPDALQIEQGNVWLHQLMAEMRQRQRYLGHLLERGFLSARDGQAMFGGFYFCATGTDPQREQAFVTHTIQLLGKNQNFVAWTNDALREDQRYRTLTVVGYVLIGVLIVTLALLSVYFWYSI